MTKWMSKGFNVGQSLLTYPNRKVSMDWYNIANHVPAGEISEEI